MTLKNMKRGETTEQISLFKWAERNAHVYRAFPSCTTSQTRASGQMGRY